MNPLAKSARYVAPLVLLVAAAVAADRSAQSSPSPLEFTVPASQLIQALERAFDGTEFSVLPPRADPFAATKARMVFGKPFGERSIEFELPDRRVELGRAGTLLYRVGEIRLVDHAIEAAEDAFVVRADFVSDGPAIKGFHDRLGDLGAPDIRLRDMRLVIRMKPGRTPDGRPTYGNIQTRFAAEYDSPVRRFTIAGRQVDLNDLFVSFDRALQKAISTELDRAFDNDAAREAFAQHLWSSVEQVTSPLGMKPQSAEFQGTSLRVRLAPR
jgi:hypothetical protein